MPKEIKYVECNCKKGKLEEIAETGVSWGFACGDGGESTIYYACNTCDLIYERERRISGNYMDNDPDTYTSFSRYTGELTKQEIIDNAPEYLGSIWGYKEKEIIKKRVDYEI